MGGKDLPAEPSEEGFRLALRSGIILCNVLNKVQPGAVAKVCLDRASSLNFDSLFVDFNLLDEYVLDFLPLGS